jgi:predicted dehydrogenase
MKALLAGFGGIGKNVYYPELKNLGYDVDILDAYAADVHYNDIGQIGNAYDLGVVCTPNFTHESIAAHLAKVGTSRIFVEKPGVVNHNAWTKLNSEFPKTQFHVVKNNLYRDDYGQTLELANEKELIGLDVTWYNKNRIPNPGSWFTNKNLAFGGVSRDLMPHLYCFAAKILTFERFSRISLDCLAKQRWNLNQISNTDYGVVTPNGVYNVDDFATAEGLDKISIRLTASWKEGYDKQSVTLFFKDGSTYEWEFGLCPAEAYGIMLQDTTSSRFMDDDLHLLLEEFRLEN